MQKERQGWPLLTKRLVAVGSLGALLGSGLITHCVLTGRLKLPFYLKGSTSQGPNDDSDYIYLKADSEEQATPSPSEVHQVLVNRIDQVHDDLRKSKHWHLLRLARLSNRSLSESAIKRLANETSFNDGQCREFSQACDFETSIKLARTPNVNLKLFLPPICKHFRFPASCEPTNSQNLLLSCLKMVSRSTSSECTKYFAQLAQKENQRLEDSELGLNQRYNLKRTNRKEVDWLSLQAIAGYSITGEVTCKALADSGLLATLHTLREVYHNELKFQGLIARIVSNLSQHQSLHRHLGRTGWVGVLAGWSQSTDIELSLPAATALNNLDRGSNSSYSEAVYLLHPLYRNQEHDFDIIFIHGLMGGVFKTWRQCDTEKGSPHYTRCWPQTWLSSDLKGVRVLAVDYHTYLSDWRIECPVERQSIEDRSKSLVQQLVRAGVGTKPIIWAGHSMGGLLTKQILLHCQESLSPEVRDIASLTQGVIFYSVPHKGSNLVWPLKMRRLALPSAEVMEVMKNSPTLISLHERFLTFARSKNIQCLSFGEALKSSIGGKKVKWKTMMVAPDSSDPGIGHFHLIPVDHFNSCKPCGQSAQEYRITLKFIANIIAESRGKLRSKDSLFEALYFLT